MIEQSTKEQAKQIALKVAFGLFGFLALIIALMVAFGKADDSSKQPECIVEILKHEEKQALPGESRTQDNYELLIRLPATDTATVFRAVNECRAHYCPDNNCLMAFYDDKKAFALYNEKQTIDPARIKDWERRNRNFMSDHTLAYSYPDESSIHYYPLVDKYYSENGGQDLRGKSFD